MKNTDEDYVWALGLNEFSLRLMGVWPNDDDFHRESITVYLRVPFMIVSMFFCIFLPQMYALGLVIRELPLVIDNLITSCASLTSCFKLFFLWRSKRVLWPVVRSVMQDWLHTGYSSDELEAMRREALRARIFTISGYVILAGTYIGFTAAPLFGFDVRMISNITDYGDRYLLVQSYFPYDYSKYPNYELTLISQIIAGFFIGMSISVPDNYFAALVFHVSAQFEILGGKLERFVERKDGKSSGKDFKRKLSSFVDRHVHLMSLITAMEHSFSYVLLSQIICMMCMLCCVGFQILILLGGTSEKPRSVQVLTLTMTLVTMMMHMLVDCFACETLAHRSSGLFHNVYNYPWYKVPHYGTKDLILMLILSRSPQFLSAGKILKLSLASYCSILKTAAGYISMLIAINGR